jgi:hypothetical protein
VPLGCHSAGDGVPSFTVGGTGSAGTVPFAPCDCSVVDGGNGSVDPNGFCSGGVVFAPGGNTGSAAAGTGVDVINDATTVSTVTGTAHP